MKSQQKINNGIRILFLGAAVALAFAACEDPVEPADGGSYNPYTQSLEQSFLGTWVHYNGTVTVEYIQLAADGTVTLWSQGFRQGEQIDVRVYGWELMPTAEGDDDADLFVHLFVQGLGVLRYDQADDVILDEAGVKYYRPQPLWKRT
jgi:hypothetical protein